MLPPCCLLGASFSHQKIHRLCTKDARTQIQSHEKQTITNLHLSVLKLQCFKNFQTQTNPTLPLQTRTAKDLAPAQPEERARLQTETVS